MMPICWEFSPCLANQAARKGKMHTCVSEQMVKGTENKCTCNASQRGAEERVEHLKI
jgi:hypothetical protein